MIHSQRINPPTKTPDRIIKHFRPLSQALLREQTPWTGRCAGCGKYTRDLDLDHANRTYDDIVDGFYQRYKLVLDETDFRTKDSEIIDKGFIEYQYMSGCIGQWLCHECHVKKTNEERKYHGN